MMSLSGSRSVVLAIMFASAICSSQPHPRPAAYSITASIACNSFSDCATSCELKNVSTRLMLQYFPIQCITDAFTTELLGDCPLAGKYPNSTVAGLQALDRELPFDEWSLNFTSIAGRANPALVLPVGQGLVNNEGMRLNNFQCGPIADNCQCSVQAYVWDGETQHDTARCGAPWSNLEQF
jgi:hypothetical protein